MENTENEVRAVQAEFRDAELIEQLDATLAPTYQRIESGWEETAARSDADIGNSEELRFVRQLAQSTVEAYQAFGKEVAKINADRGLNSVGKQERIIPEREKRDAQIEQARARVATLANSLASRYQEKTFPSPSPELFAEASLTMQRFSLMDAGSFASEVGGVISRASDPSTPMAERARLNQLLSLAYKPLIDRRARAPESHARKLAPVAEKLSKAIEKHLDVVLDRPASRAAKEMAGRFAQELGSVDAWATNPRTWGLLAGGSDEGPDWELIKQAHPLLFPRAG